MTTELWFTEEQVKVVGKGLYDFDASAAEAAMDIVTVHWEGLSQEVQKKWFDRARAQLATVVPLDLSRPLRLRDGTPVTGARLSDDGLQIIADVPSWGSTAAWPRSGRYDGDEHPTDLIYADRASADIALEARAFAYERHIDQKRRYTGEPYFSHLEEVAGMVEKAGLSHDAIAAAWLHDVVEDCGVELAEIRERFGLAIAVMVRDLTSTPPSLGINRAQRQESDRATLSVADVETQGVKCADLISNTSTIVKHDPDFAKKYLPEKRAILEVLTKAPSDLLAAAWASLEAAEKELEEAAS